MNKVRYPHAAQLACKVLFSTALAGFAACGGSAPSAPQPAPAAAPTPCQPQARRRSRYFACADFKGSDGQRDQAASWS